MKRFGVVLLLLISFASSVLAYDSCCQSSPQQHSEVGSDDCDQSGDLGSAGNLDCATCVTCASQMSCPSPQVVVSVDLDFLDPLSQYTPLIAPTPDLLDFLRPPIA